MKKLVLPIPFFLIGFFLSAQQEIRIGLFQESLLNSFVFHCVKGEYQLVHNEGEIMLKEGNLLYFNVRGNKILASDGDLRIGEYESLDILDITGNGVFRLRPVNPSMEARNYQGELELSANHESLHLVNIIDLNKYLAGVVETEGGPSAHIEYYKAQAILCRTYTIKNFHSHESEGFNLCDHTHCQAYKGISEQNPDIHEAVLATHNILLTGRFLKLADAVYHSNSGGETQRASDIWVGEDGHLQSVIDPFSLSQHNSKWERTMSIEIWRNYLFSRNMTAALQADPQALLIRQPNRRRFFVLEKDTLSIDRIRADFNFRSGFFDMELRGQDVVFYGKGYGHGVGMSQEGAMNMAKQGFSFPDILRFYYHQVQIREILGVPDENLPEEFRYH